MGAVLIVSLVGSRLSQTCGGSSRLSWPLDMPVRNFLELVTEVGRVILLGSQTKYTGESRLSSSIHLFLLFDCRLNTSNQIMVPAAMPCHPHLHELHPLTLIQNYSFCLCYSLIPAIRYMAKAT